MRLVSGPSAFLASTASRPMKPAGLVEVDSEAQPRLEDRVGVVDVVAVVAVALLHAQARQCLEPRVAQVRRLAGFDESVVDVGGLLGRDVELVAELTEVGDPDAQHPRVADRDLPCGAERERVVGHVRVGDGGEDLARSRALDVELGVAGRDVGDQGVRVIGEVAAHPRLGMAVGGVRCHHPESVLVELGDGEVGLQRAAVVEPLGVGDETGLGVDAVRREVVEEGSGVTALHEELRHERHVHRDDAVAGCLVLGLPVGEPVLPAPREPLDGRLGALEGRTSRHLPSR